MKIFVTPFVMLATIIIGACSHPIEIVGQGDVDSDSGARDCSLADFQAGKANCSKNMVVEAYLETYRAVPHGGWRFDHWENYCSDGTTGNRCSFNIPADTVSAHWGETMPPLRAVFYPQDGFRNGVVSTSHPLASEAGAAVLRAGGNAVDAAVTMQFVLNVVEPQSSGIGGGGFMGIHLAAGDRTFFIDAREKAPAAATPTMFMQCEPNCTASDTELNGSFSERATSGISVGVPGTLLGVARALERYGSLSLAEALQPAIELAENGFIVDQRLASETASSRTAYWPETRAIFRTTEGNPLPKGFRLVQADLAKTLRLIARDGVSAVYTGEIAQAIITAQQRYRSSLGARGAGRMSRQDLADYLAADIIERSPVITSYRNVRLYGMPAPSSGGYTLAQILACIEQFPIGDRSLGFGAGSLKTLHVIAESMRLAFSSRSVWMGDADLVSLPKVGLTSTAYLEPRCAQIKTDRRIAEPEPGDPRAFDPSFAQQAPADILATAQYSTGVNTTHLTAIDRNGNVVSFTSTIESTWGSGITVPGYGFLLNNELTDFNPVPAANANAEIFNPGANDVAPRKKPRSSMSPLFVFKDGRMLAAYGSPGGATIINTVVNMTVNLIDHSMSLPDAIDEPRFHAVGDEIRVEQGFSGDVLNGLSALGHTVVSNSGGKPIVQGAVQAIRVDPATGVYTGAADPRRSGESIGLP